MSASQSLQNSSPNNRRASDIVSADKPILDRLPQSKSGHRSPLIEPSNNSESHDPTTAFYNRRIDRRSLTNDDSQLPSRVQVAIFTLCVVKTPAQHHTSLRYCSAKLFNISGKFALCSPFATPSESDGVIISGLGMPVTRIAPGESCLCGRTFHQASAFTNHKRKCLRSRKQLTGALEKAKQVWSEKKKIRLAQLKIDVPQRRHDASVAMSG
jgi:hypothetical protein